MLEDFSSNPSLCAAKSWSVSSIYCKPITRMVFKANEGSITGVKL